jgi:hypothetical protein
VKLLRVKPRIGVVGVLATLVGSLALTGVVAVAAGNPSANLDQCANDPLPSSHLNGCATTGSQWVNGNLGSSKSVYFEGDSIPYRLTFGSLVPGATVHTVTIEWDTTKAGKHAIDYIDTVNQSVTDANPCLGVTGCSASTFDTEPIPADVQVTNAGKTPIAGDFRLYGGTITAVGAPSKVGNTSCTAANSNTKYCYSAGTGFTGDKSAAIKISFTTTVANPVLAWGGHIATRADWTATGSAVAISGSPYHTRLIDLDGSGGNQDRSLSADAVIFPGSITIIKDAVPDNAQDFAYSTTGGLLPATFSLDDDQTNTLSNTQTYSNITSFVTYTVAETKVASWTASFAAPPCVLTSDNGGSSSAAQSTTAATVTINMKEGENYSCTFTNTRQSGSITLTKVVQSNHGGNAAVGDFPLLLAGATVTSGTSNSRDAGSYSVNETQQTGYEFVSITGDAACPSALGGSITLAQGQNVSCTITNRDIAPTLALNKTVSNDHGGGASEDDFVLSATPSTGSVITDAGGDVPATDAVSNVVYTLSETSLTGYTAGTWSCSGTGVTWDSGDPTHVTLAEGAVGSCGITNSDAKNNPSGNTTMSWTLQDSVTFGIRAGASDASSATIDFKLYSAAGCADADQVLPTEGGIAVTLNGAGDQASAATATGYDVAPGTYYWRAFYSGDSNNNAASTACGSEVTTISDDSPTP